MIEEEIPIMEEEVITCNDDYCITEVDITWSNSSEENNISVEGSKKIDLNNDGIDDINLGIGYRRNSSALQSFNFTIETIQPEVFIACNSFIDTIYECQNDTLNSAGITIFHDNGEFICSNPETMDIYEASLINHPIPFDFYEPSNSNFQWINDDMILSSCSNSSWLGITNLLKYDFWLNQNSKYMLFEIRGTINKKAFLKLDTDETGSLHIYEIGLEK